MARRNPSLDSEAAEFPVRKDDARGCDLHHLFSKLTDQICGEFVTPDTILSLNLCPELRAPRLVASQIAADLFRTTVLCAAALWSGGVLSILADGIPTEVSVAVGVRVDPATTLDHPVLRMAAATARDAEAELTVRITGDRLTLSLVIQAPLAPPGVLLVEADNPQRAEIRAALLDAGFAVEVAAGPEALLRLLASGPYAAVLIDMEDERSDVVAIARTARGAHPDTAVFALAPQDLAPNRQMLDQAGFAGMLRKPFSADRLRALIGR
ncbi:hypothetical protein P7B02_19050 [Caulobacter segnis]|uniref:response regulator n=1 Tax=Caulobacter segnis TaxID=88688 RepID=UPI00240ED602|nr:response regulator [Caulobacter segnis]MDG2523631.1 hypothetical protein [Caulobacter segnis]